MLLRWAARQCARAALVVSWPLPNPVAPGPSPLLKVDPLLSAQLSSNGGPVLLRGPPRHRQVQGHERPFPLTSKWGRRKTGLPAAPPKPPALRLHHWIQGVQAQRASQKAKQKAVARLPSGRRSPSLRTACPLPLGARRAHRVEGVASARPSHVCRLPNHSRWRRPRAQPPADLGRRRLQHGPNCMLK